MDTIIEAEVITKKRRKAILITILTVTVLIFSVWLLRASFQSILKKSEITTAVVEIGNIENTINATGEILPEFEEIITSPIDASIQNAVVDAGNSVKPGQSIVTLDKSAAQADYEKLKFQLESKRNEIQKLKLDLDKSFYDIKSNNDIKQLRINSLEADVENAKQDLKVARLEKQQLENEIKNKQQTMQIEMREAQIAADIEENDLHELERKLQQANIVATRAGVVTWVNKNIGAAIQQGESIARIADLSSFKVTGSISDNYLDQLHNGMSAIIRINETDIRGTVVKDGKAERRTVHTGMSNFDYVEIKDNVKPGDVIIISDMKDYKNSKEIVIKN